MIAKPALTADRLRELVSYDPETGVFTRLVSIGQIKKGASAGSIDGGYMRFRVDGTLYYAHRLAMLYMTGRWPKSHTDHVNGDGLDNRFCNLRNAEAFENARNRTGPQSDNKCGHLGVHLNQRGKWCAGIKIKGRQQHLGSFTDIDDAIAARQAAEARFFGVFAPLPPAPPEPAP